jgi:hypothetical protein
MTEYLAAATDRLADPDTDTPARTERDLHVEVDEGDPDLLDTVDENDLYFEDDDEDADEMGDA